MKGQWFLISAVVATSVFLAISFMFKSYFIADSTTVAKMNEDYYFNDIRQQFQNVVMNSNCANTDENAREFRALTEKEMGNLGYLLFLNYSIDCNAKEYTLGLLLASENAIFCQNVNATDILPDKVAVECQ